MRANYLGGGIFKTTQHTDYAANARASLLRLFHSLSLSPTHPPVNHNIEETVDTKIEEGWQDG